MTRKMIFADDADTGPRQVVLPWGRTFAMCWSNVQHRIGRSVLSLICITMVVAFFMSSMTYQNILSRLMASDDVHTQAVLEKAGVFTNDDYAVQKQRDQRVWLMSLAGFLCLVGITNTILMSVTERFREIGTLKCLGALDGFVVRLFIVENILIGALGSLAGGILGCVLAILQLGAVFEFSLLELRACAGAFTSNMPIALTLGTVLTLLASAYPTYVASRMNPVDAMRVEI